MKKSADDLTMAKAREFVAAQFSKFDKPLSKHHAKLHGERLKFLAEFITFCRAGK